MKSQRPSLIVEMELPNLNADEALLAADILDAALDAIWRTYGDAMTERLVDKGALPPRPEHDG